MRANFKTENTNFVITDSHFDIVKSSIGIPDSTSWVEQDFGTHPFQTFVALADDGKELLLDYTMGHMNSK